MTEQQTKKPWLITLEELIELAESWGGLVQMSALDADGNPTASVICVLGADQCREIGAFVESIQARSEKE